MGRKKFHNKPERKEAKKIQTEDFEFIEFYDEKSKNEKYHIYNLDLEEDLTVIVESNVEEFEVRKIPRKTCEFHEIFEEIETSKAMLNEIALLYKKEKNIFTEENEKRYFENKNLQEKNRDLIHANYLIVQSFREHIDDIFYSLSVQSDELCMIVEKLMHNFERRRGENKKIQERHISDSFELKAYRKERLKLESKIEIVENENKELAEENKRLKEIQMKNIEKNTEKKSQAKFEEQVAKIEEKYIRENDILRKEISQLKYKFDQERVKNYQLKENLEGWNQKFMQIKKILREIHAEIFSIQINEPLILVEKMGNIFVEEERKKSENKKIYAEILHIFSIIENIDLEIITEKITELINENKKFENKERENNFEVYYEKIKELKNSYEKEIKVLNLKLKLLKNSHKNFN